MILPMGEMLSVQHKLKKLFRDERELDVLSRTLAKKMLIEEKNDLPAEVLAEICGVSQEKWQAVYGEKNSLLYDLLSNPVIDAINMLNSLDAEERSFMDKFRLVLSAVYQVNYDYPELIVLFYHQVQGGNIDENNVIMKTTRELQQLAYGLLKRQAYEESLVEEGSSLETLLFFLIQQILQRFHQEMFSFCDDFVNTNNHTVFPDEDEIIDKYMSPIREQLEGIIAS